jgi:hypothetical protein
MKQIKHTVDAILPYSREQPRQSQGHGQDHPAAKDKKYWKK